MFPRLFSRCVDFHYVASVESRAVRCSRRVVPSLVLMKWCCGIMFMKARHSAFFVCPVGTIYLIPAIMSALQPQPEDNMMGNSPHRDEEDMDEEGYLLIDDVHVRSVASQRAAPELHDKAPTVFRDSLTLTVNGVEHTIPNPQPTLLLSDYLRESLGLTGTKVACGEGGCGACTVVAEKRSSPPVAINACLRLLCQCDGLSVTTVEGLGSHGCYSEVQKTLADGNGSQCGFCSPGWVTAMSALLERARRAKRGLSAKEIETSFDGNLCRCTGYRPILESFKKAFSGDIEDAVRSRCGGRHGSSREGACDNCPARTAACSDSTDDSTDASPSSSTTSLKLDAEHPTSMRSCCDALHFSDSERKVDWYRVVSFEQLIEVCKAARAKEREVRGREGESAGGGTVCMAGHRESESFWGLLAVRFRRIRRNTTRNTPRAPAIIRQFPGVPGTVPNFTCRRLLARRKESYDRHHRTVPGSPGNCPKFYMS